MVADSKQEPEPSAKPPSHAGASRNPTGAGRLAADMLEGISDGFYALDENWRFTYINRRGEEILQSLRTTAGGLLGKYYWDEFPHARGNVIEENYRRAVRDRVTVTFEAYIASRKQWLDVRAYPFDHGLLVYFRDNTRRIESSHVGQMLAAVVESSDDAIISMGLNTIVSTWNRGAQRTFGYTAEEVIGKSITILIPKHHENEEPEILRRLLSGERVDHYETVRQRKDGVLIDVSLTVSPVYNSAGEIVAVSKISRDITDRKRAEKELREAQEQLRRHAGILEAQVAERTARLRETIQELEAFSYSVSHDMRSPLRAMHGYADALLEEYSAQLDATGQDYLKRIRRAASRMDLLIQDVLAYSRVSKGEIRLEKVNVEAIIHDVINTYPNLRDRGDVSIASPLPAVVGHEAYLTQIISNLLSNAIKFVEPNVRPRVEIRGIKEGNMVRLTFEDNGVGIAPEHQEQVFQIFGRVYSDKKFEGTGIGLAIVKKAAERMGGWVSVESTPGKGSRFHVFLKQG